MTSRRQTVGIVGAVPGRIWFGPFTPTDAAGAALALVPAIRKGMRYAAFINAIYSVGKTAAPILILPLAVALYSRMLAFGFDQVSFAIVGIIVIEAGLLTPPFGLLVYTVKAAIADSTVGVQQIFRSSIPYWFIMLIAATLLVVFPDIANVLPNAVM